MIVHWLPHNASKLARNFHVPALKGADLGTSKFTEKVSELENHILAGTRFRCLAPKAAHVVGREQHDREADIAVCFDFLDDCQSAINLLMQNYRRQSDVLQESGDGIAGIRFLAMDDEYLLR